MALSSETDAFRRSFTDHVESRPPPINVRYFYTSPLAIDDPLSPLPPPVVGTASASKQAPRPFSRYDNDALEKSWLDVRRRLLKQIATSKQEQGQRSRAGTSNSANSTALTTALSALRKGTGKESNARSLRSASAANSPRLGPQKIPASDASMRKSGEASTSSSFRAVVLGDGSLPTLETSSTTGNPFIRAPVRSETKTFDAGTSRTSRSTSSRPKPRPTNGPVDSYNWGEDTFGAEPSESRNVSKTRESSTPQPKEDQITDKVAVGVSRLHSVVFPGLSMEPIYWIPVKDVAPVQRATWFYADNMMPVETDVANLLELGYVEMRAWTETWKDELNSAIDVGAAGESRILHRLWPAKAKVKLPGKSGASIEVDMTSGPPLSPMEDIHDKEKREILTMASDLIDVTNGPNGPDNKAAGVTPWGRDGALRLYKSAGVIYANAKEAYILRPNLQPSEYHGRRPLANYIRKKRDIGVRVIRGFDEAFWDKLYKKQKGSKAKKASEGVSASAAGVSPGTRQAADPDLAQSQRPEVTDLVLVIHGIGQKLSERMESYHFTHSINSFRREVNVELGDDKVKPSLRDGCGGIMVLPVNWRLTLSFEDGGYKDTDDISAPAGVDYSLQDITPTTLPSVRGIVSDVMLDIPYYLTPGYHDKMVAAVVREANRIYHLWCQNNPRFAKEGRVHVIAHSLGAVMAIDILSSQPTRLHFDQPFHKLTMDELPKMHFVFDVHNLFLAGSPAGFFLLLKRVGLLPRRGRNKPGHDDVGEDTTPGVTGEQGTYGCLAVDNIYNIVNGYDPVAYCLNATIDADYAAALKPAQVPSSSTSWLSFPFRSSSTSNSAVATNTTSKPPTARLPSTVELETHDFTREEIAERKAFLLNDNGQIDYFLKYGGGPLEIQYLTMLGAHSSYWLARDFVRLVVIEVGRPFGREGTLPGMRAVKKKKILQTGQMQMQSPNQQGDGSASIGL